MKRIAIHYDKCDGCKNCTLACMQAHRTDEGTIYTLDLSDPANQSRHRIQQGPDGKYYPLFCMHCDDPECVATCITGAMTKDPVTGHVQYDSEQCASCYMCVMNCPYGILRTNAAGDGVIKCDFCIQDDSQPNCVKACPKQAITVVEV